MFNRVSGKTSSVPAGLAAGAIISMGITVFGAVLLSVLMDREIIDWKAAGYLIMATLLTAAFAGASASYARIRHQKLVICLMSGSLYFGLLLTFTLLFFGGQFEAFWETALLIAGGSLCAAMAGNKRKHRKPIRGI